MESPIQTDVLDYKEPTTLPPIPSTALEQSFGKLPLNRWKDTGRTVELKIIDDATTLTTGDGKLIFCVPNSLDGSVIVDAQAFVTTVSSSGLPTIQLRNVTDSVDLLLTKITIDASEFTSYTATQRVIDPTKNFLSKGDLIAVDVDVAGTGAKGLGVILEFQ